MTRPPHERFELPIEIQPSDVDVLGHVNNVVYLRWVQDAAVAHWTVLATPEEKAAMVWVVVRHEIDYRHPARPGDRIVARTWVGTSSRHTFERHTEIVRAGDLRLLARARTLWCPLDRGTGRPARVGAETRRRFSVSEDPPASREGGREQRG